MISSRYNTLLTRPIELPDGEAIAEILNAFFEDIGRAGHFSGDGVRGRLQTPALNRETHTRLVMTDSGHPIGYAFLWKNELPKAAARLIWVVHPDFRGSGAGHLLLNWAEEQLRRDVGQAPNTERLLQAESLSPHDGSRELYEQFGYQVVRYFWEMKITLDAEPSSPIFPQDVRVRTFDIQNDAESVYRTMKEIFSTHWGYHNEAFEVGFPKFLHEIESDPSFDPTLWFLLADNEGIVGMALCKLSSEPEDGLAGYISRFGISQSKRRQGLGKALLQHVFHQFYRHGCTTVRLDVDAANTTGATRLYKKVGMTIDKQWRIYEKGISKG